MNEINRRSFVKQTSGALAGLSLLHASNPSRILGANEKLNIASIGVRGMGMSDTKNFIQTGQTNIVALCDVDQKVLEEAQTEVEKYQGTKPKGVKDYREVLDNSEVDAVIIGTPDHWHAIMAIEACKAGKDIYVEKPCAHNVHECRQIAEAAKKYKRVVQHGTQQRSGEHFQKAKEYVQSGKLGKIALCRNWAILGRGSIGHAVPEEPPAHLDYNFWLGPAPKKQYTENRCHYRWRFMWDYGTGDMGNWGVHWLDIAIWALDLGWPTAVSSSGGMFIFDDDKETPDTQMTLYEYPNLTVMWELRMWSKHGFGGRGTGTAFYGEDQTLIVNREGYQIYSKDGEELLEEGKPTNNSNRDHKFDFIDAVKKRRAPIADISQGQISAGIAILGNVAYLADEKIRYNPETDQLDDSDKDELLTREYRRGYELPEV